MYIPSSTTRVIVQGATGKEGQRAVEYMVRFGTKVVAGVTPGKGGQSVHGVPIFNSVNEAIALVGPVDASSLYVPPFSTLSAVKEALSGGVRFIHILTEGVPYKDVSMSIDTCTKAHVTLLGPGSLGYMAPGKIRIGMLGGLDAHEKYIPGGLALVSRSGGMANEIAHALYIQERGLHSMVHVGGELLTSTTVVEWIQHAMDNDEVSKVALFEESTYSLDTLTEYVSTTALRKPFILYLVGLSQYIIPHGAQFGHISSLMKKDTRTLERSIEILSTHGVYVATSYTNFLLSL